MASRALVVSRSVVGSFAFAFAFACAGCGTEAEDARASSQVDAGSIAPDPSDGAVVDRSDAAVAAQDAAVADAPYTPPDLGPVPAWREGMAKWEWKEIAGTSITTVKVPDPFSGALVAPTSRIDAWNGIAANRDTNRIYLADAGGHADWAGNEVYELDLNALTPAWKLLRGPTMAPDVLGSNYNTGTYHHYYADGRPSSTHLYFALQFVRARGRIFKMSSGSIWGTGNESNNKVDGFDLAKNDWDPEGTFAETPGGSPPSPTADGPTIARPYAQHLDSDDIYTFFSGAFRKWTASTATWSKLADRPGYANNDIVSESASAVDSKRDKVLFAKNAYRVAQQQGLILDVASNAVTDASFTGSAAASVVRAGQSMLFLPSEDAYFLKTESGGELIRIDPTTFAAEPFATSGPMPPNAVNGIYTRFLYLPRLKGIVYEPSGAANVWFLATE
jgi:hypothetical protein